MTQEQIAEPLMAERLKRAYRRHEPFLIVLLLFATFRLLALLLFRPGGFISDFSDYDFYATWGQLTPMGYRVFDNLWTAYPPLFPALMLPIFELSSRVPPWVEPRLFFHLYFGTFLLIFEIGNLILIYTLSNRLVRDEQRPDSPYLQATILYALLFTPVYTLLGWFEPIPLFFMLLGLDLLFMERSWGWAGSAVAAALGFLTKLTPIVLLPIAIRKMGARFSWDAARREWFNPRSRGNLLKPALYVLLFVATVLAIGYPITRANPQLALSSFRVQSIRPPWQSVWALIDGYFGFGLVPLDMRNLAGLGGPLWGTKLPWGLITLAFLALYLWLYTRRYDWTRVRTTIAFSAVSLLWLFLYSKGWSPQFLVWVLAFIVLLLPTMRGVTIAVVLSLTNFVEANVFLILLPDEHWLMWATVLTRTLLLIALLVEFLGQIWPKVERGRQMRRASAAAGWLVMAGSLVGAVIALPRAAQAYEARRWQELDCALAVEVLREEASDGNGIIVTEQIEIWRDLYPWLRNEYAFHVLDGYDPVRTPEDVVDEKLRILAETGEFWWVERATSSSVPSTADDRFSALADVHLLDEQILGGCQLRRMVQLDESTNVATADVAGGPILLRHVVAQAARPGDALTVVLYWQAGSPVDESYTVFTQLFGPEDEMIAQQDNLPVGGLAPTETWPPGRLIRDAYRLSIPAGTTPGDHRLIVGLYNEEGRRMLERADGTVGDHATFVVAVEKP